MVIFGQKAGLIKFLQFLAIMLLTLLIQSIGQSSNKIEHFENGNVLVQLKVAFYDFTNKSPTPS